MTLKTKLPSFVAVPSDIIDEHLGKASGLYIKVILYILRTNKIDPPVIAAVLSVPVSDVEEAIRYWTSSGILPAEEVERQLEAGKKQQAQAAQLPRGSSDSPETVETSHFKVSADREEVRFLLTTAEQILGRPLSSTEQKGFVFFLEEYDLPADVIVMAVEFCCMHDRGNYRYISKLLAGWHEQGINTHPLAEEYIRTQTERLSHEAEVMEAFGIKNRGLTTANRKYIMQWYQDYGFNIEIIRMAYERAVDQIGQASFPYIGKILQNWHKMGFKTPEDILRGDVKKNNSGNNGGKSSSGTGSPSYDVEAFARQGFDLPDID